jgi:CheY-like chemotaxis protein
VEDEEIVRLSTADMLMDLGYQVVEAASAEEASRRCSSQGMRKPKVSRRTFQG